MEKEQSVEEPPKLVEEDKSMDAGQTIQSETLDMWRSGMEFTTKTLSLDLKKQNTVSDLNKGVSISDSKVSDLATIDPALSPKSNL